MVINLLFCLFGFIILIYAADKLVEGASYVAMNFGISRTVVGLTIVAAGTSLPELVVSVNATMKGNGPLSLGNVVGSNIMNIALILGISSLICPIACDRSLLKRDAPLMILISGLVWYMAYTGSIITPLEGAILLLLFFFYFAMTYVVGKKEAEQEAINKEASKEEGDEGEKEPQEPIPSNLKSAGIILVGFIGLVLGAELLVRGAVYIAKEVGVTDEIIGLTLVAIGTSLPELATSVVAARKGESDIALSNVIGSNIFNLLGIVGAAGALPYFSAQIQPLTVSEMMVSLHLPIMMVTALALLPIMRTGMKIVRLEGLLLLVGYIVYTVMLIQTAGA
jgi:cation:H+ antiporter